MTSHLGLYMTCDWQGRPFLDASGALVPQVIADTARFGTVILEATPLEQRPQIADALRAANPNVRIIGFISLAQAYYNPNHTLGDATDFTGECYRAVAAVPNGRGFLWSAKYPPDLFDPEHLPPAWPRPGGPAWSGYSLNLACPEAVEALADVVIRRVVMNPMFAGFFADRAQPSIAWTSSDAGDVLDFRRAGFGSLADFDAAYREGHRQFFRLLHDAAPDGFSIGLNAWPDPTYAAYVNGYMVENFPTAPGDRHDAKAWLDIMQALWAFERNRGADAECWINQQPDAGGLDWTVEANAGAIAFGLGSALLTDSARWSMSCNGRPDPDGRERRWGRLYGAESWLGSAIGKALRVGGDTWQREFATGLVSINAATRAASFYERRE